MLSSKISSAFVQCVVIGSKIPIIPFRPCWGSRAEEKPFETTATNFFRGGESMNDNNFRRAPISDEPTIDCRLSGKQSCSESATILAALRVRIVRHDVCQTSPARTLGLAVHKPRTIYITFSVSLSFQPTLLPGPLNHFHEHFPGLQRGGYFAEEVDTDPFDSVLCLQPKRETQAVNRSHACLDCLHLRIGSCQQHHRVDVIGVHVSEDAGRGFGQRIRCSTFVVSSFDPSHYAKTTHIVEGHRLEAEEAEVIEVSPVAAVFMASKVPFSNRSNIMLWYGFGMTDQGRPRCPKWVAIGTCLFDEKTASRIGLQVLGVHGHIANEEGGPAGRIEGEGHQRAEGKSRTLAGERGQRTDRHQ